ncbi:MAG: hypothetical protein ACXWIN_06150 [Burkholderiaceae bacterium]
MNLVYTIAVIVIGILGFFGFLNWRTGKKYKPSRDEVEDKLRRVLNGTMTWEEWDEFICVPIRHDKELDLVRIKCAEMKGEEYYHRENVDDQKKWVFNERGLEQVGELLSKLKRQNRS